MVPEDHGGTPCIPPAAATAASPDSVPTAIVAHLAQSYCRMNISEATPYLFQIRNQTYLAYVFHSSIRKANAETRRDYFSLGYFFKLPPNC